VTSSASADATLETVAFIGDSSMRRTATRRRASARAPDLRTPERVRGGIAAIAAGPF
jgi:hypothetical protein